MSSKQSAGHEEIADVMRPILNSIDEGIHAVNKDGITIFYNDVAGKLDGLSPDEVIGKHVLDIFPSLSMESSTLLKVLETGKPIYNKQQTFTTYRGHKIHTVNTTWPILSQGSLIGAVEVSKDITQVIELSEQLIDLRTRILKHRDTSSESPLSATYTFANIYTEDAEMLQLKQSALKAAETSLPVLIYGETGTGKELFVQAIHNASRRRAKPFIAQNCAALPTTLLESILFGTVKGSFTGAENRPGLFELASGGTLLLDEINSMPAEVQAKLLRVIQDGQVRRIGDSKVTPVDVRVIAATNVEPDRLLQEGLLRSDLYYRLNVVYLEIPPLRKRTIDIDLLSAKLLENANIMFGKNIRGLTDRAKTLFHSYSWPGNVRELQNAIHAALHVMEGEWLDIDHLPKRIRMSGHGAETAAVQAAATSPVPTVTEPAAPEGTSSSSDQRQNGKANALSSAGHSPSTYEVTQIRPLRETLQEVETSLITAALERTEGNVQLAAKLLEIPRQTLQYKLSKLPVTSPHRG